MRHASAGIWGPSIRLLAMLLCLVASVGAAGLAAAAVKGEAALSECNPAYTTLREEMTKVAAGYPQPVEIRVMTGAEFTAFQAERQRAYDETPPRLINISPEWPCNSEKSAYIIFGARLAGVSQDEHIIQPPQPDTYPEPEPVPGGTLSGGVDTDSGVAPGGPAPDAFPGPSGVSVRVAMPTPRAYQQAATGAGARPALSAELVVTLIVDHRRPGYIPNGTRKTFAVPRPAGQRPFWWTSLTFVKISDTAIRIEGLAGTTAAGQSYRLPLREIPPDRAVLQLH